MSAPYCRLRPAIAGGNRASIAAPRIGCFAIGCRSEPVKRAAARWAESDRRKERGELGALLRRNSLYSPMLGVGATSSLRPFPGTFLYLPWDVRAGVWRVYCETPYTCGRYFDGKYQANPEYNNRHAMCPRNDARFHRNSDQHNRSSVSEPR